MYYISMELEQLFVGFILFVFGGLMAIKPKVYLKLQIWMQKKIMGANYDPSQRTAKIVKLIGLIFVVLGLVNLIGGI